ncbi:MAG: hypothetical protein HON83_05575 [Candidatus Marinimicrobia bacterium]|jgi:hypothetical protein|nr:hypothetical protein [Candidatus Neomarinimicrobiota bacterium]MBT5418653.1 hypothetical protein [Thiotrichales bacterium]MBT7314305.1 hypothetical protein [Thiotrichales bacterium]
MKTNSKLAILELVSGIFGWVWIIASLAALYFLAISVFSDGIWSNFFWAVGTSIVAKWLTRSIEDSKTRVALEAKLVEEGHSPEEAGQIWLQQYSKNGSVDLPSNKIEIIVQAYGGVLENSAPVPGCVSDSKNLPYSKQEIKQALIAALKLSADPKIKEYLKTGYIGLADWQDGVGDSEQGLDVSTLDMSQDTQTLAKTVIEQSERSEKWNVLVQQEQEVLKQELQALGLW